MVDKFLTIGGGRGRKRARKPSGPQVQANKGIKTKRARIQQPDEVEVEDEEIDSDVIISEAEGSDEKLDDVQDEEESDVSEGDTGDTGAERRLRLAKQYIDNVRADIGNKIREI